MESPTDQRESSHMQAAVAGAVSSDGPRLVLLPPFGKYTDDFSVVADSKTTSAASSTSRGRRFHLSFGLVPSPGISNFCYGWEDKEQVNKRYALPIILAAHGDCLLLEVTTPSTLSLLPLPPPDYFLYQASTARRPPSLLLLPPCYICRQYDRRSGKSPRKPRHLVPDGTGLLRRGDDDILVAQLELKSSKKVTGELCFLRPGRDRQWQLTTGVPIIVDDDDNKGRKHDKKDECPLRWWSTDAAFAVGDRFLCWVDYLRGFLFMDMAAVTSRLRYAPLPIVPPSGNPEHTEGGRSKMVGTRNLAAAGDAGSVRFVDVESRCCCGDPGPGSTRCEHGRILFTVATWTLKLSMDEDEPLEWVKDGVLDCDELWAQPGYTGLPRVSLEYPVVVNSDDPDAVWFVVDSGIVDKNVWTIEVDTRKKVLRSVVLFNGDKMHHPKYSIFPAKIQD